MELNSEVLAMQKWNMPRDRAKRVDEKNEFIHLSSYYFYSWSNLKNGQFLYFSCIIQFWQNT